MRNTVSKINHGLSWLIGILTLIATIYWFSIVLNRNPWFAIAFISLVVPWLAVGSVVLGLLPSVVLYVAMRQRRDLLSVRLSGCSCLALLSETVALYFIPFHGAC